MFGMKRLMAGAALVAALALAGAAQTGTAQAGEVFGGAYAHGVGTKQSQEGGADFMAGVRSERIDGLWWLFKPAVHGMVSFNTNVDTHFIAGGFNWPIPILHSQRWYVRPGIGLAYTTGEADIGNAFDARVSASERARRARLAATRIDFGSSVLFEPELALGYRINDAWKVEASFVHLSNGQILHSGKNQGLDDVGVRLSRRF